MIAPKNIGFKLNFIRSQACQKTAALLCKVGKDFWTILCKKGKDLAETYMLVKTAEVYFEISCVLRPAIFSWYLCEMGEMASVWSWGRLRALIPDSSIGSKIAW